MQPLELILHSVALAVSAGVALWIDLASSKRGLQPPGFAFPHRRWAAFLLLAATFYLAVFGPVAGVGTSEPADLSSIDTPWLFALHFLMAVVLLIWYALGFVAVRPPPTAEVAGELESDSPAVSDGTGQPPPGPLARLARQFGLVTRRPLEDIALGLAGGIACWVGMVVVMMIVVGLFVALGGEDSLPQAAPQAVSFMVGLPWLIRLALSVSAGFFEEVFFRGFLQGRTGVLLSTLLFVLAHASYEQPFMLVGLTFLSLMLAYSVVWRQNIWPAIIAHATFDAVQLLVVIPLVLEMGVSPQ